MLSHARLEQPGELRTGVGSDAPGATTLRCGRPWVLSFHSYIGPRGRARRTTSRPRTHRTHFASKCGVKNKGRFNERIHISLAPCIMRALRPRLGCDAPGAATEMWPALGPLRPLLHRIRWGPTLVFKSIPYLPAHHAPPCGLVEVAIVAIPRQSGATWRAPDRRRRWDPMPQAPPLCDVVGPGSSPSTPTSDRVGGTRGTNLATECASDGFC